MATYAEPTGGATAIGVKPRRASWLRRIAWRIVGAIIVLWAVATVVFFVQQLIPGNQATLILNEQTGNQQNYSHHQLAPTEAKYGLDQPVMTQYFDYIKGLAHGDIGKSYTQFKPVTSIIGEQVGPTLVLTIRRWSSPGSSPSARSSSPRGEESPSPRSARVGRSSAPACPTTGSG